jgi:trehalose synthase
VNYSGVECNYRLVLTGSNPKDNKISNSYFEQLLEVIGRASEDIQKRIEISFDRSREQITEYYSKAFAVLYAGREEDFGQTVVEGMMSCKPVVAINEGGMRETIKDGVNGFLVNSTDQMADKMLVLVNNRSMARSMGLKGKEMVSKFEDDKFLSVILSL